MICRFCWLAQLAACRTLAKLGTHVQRLRYPQFASGPKRSAPPGGRKNNFFNSRIGGPAVAAAPVESCQSLPKRSPWGRLGRYYTRASAYAAYAAASSIFGHFSADRQAITWPWFASDRDTRLRIDGVCGAGAYPQPDLPEASGSRSAPEKVCNLDPMAPRSRQKRQLPEGPQ